MKTKKTLPLLLALILALSCLVSCEIPFAPKPTNEELIEERINTFLTAYNSGDMETVLECLDAKNRQTFQAMLNILGGFAGALTGFSVDLSDLFALGISTASGDFMKLKITDIKVTDSTNAVVTATMDLNGSDTHTIYLKMVYENDGWYIQNMTDQKTDVLPLEKDDRNTLKFYDGNKELIATYKKV